MENLPALQEKAITLRDYLNKDQIKNQLAVALPKWLSVDRLLRIVFTSTMKNPQLLDCSRESLLQSIMQCAQLGLEPILGRAYLIPYNNSKKTNGKWQKVLECQFQPGYQGLVDLARRSGEIKDVTAQVVYSEDYFEIEFGTDKRLIHRPCITGDRGEALGAYTVWEHENGTKTFDFMPVSDINKVRDRSQAYQYAISNPDKKSAQECPWIQWPDEMMKKTIVKRHSKMQPASIEFMEAVELDNAAEVGKTQAGMFGNDLNFNLLPEPETLDTSDFDRMVSELIDYPPDATVDRFISMTAEAQGVEVDKLKVEAAKDFTSFWNAFESWREKAYPAQAPELTEPDLKSALEEAAENETDKYTEALLQCNMPKMPKGKEALNSLYNKYQEIVAK